MGCKQTYKTKKKRCCLPWNTVTMAIVHRIPRACFFLPGSASHYRGYCVLSLLHYIYLNELISVWLFIVSRIGTSAANHLVKGLLWLVLSEPTGPIDGNVDHIMAGWIGKPLMLRLILRMLERSSLIYFPWIVMFMIVFFFLLLLSCRCFWSFAGLGALKELSGSFYSNTLHEGIGWKYSTVYRDGILVVNALYFKSSYTF